MNFVQFSLSVTVKLNFVQVQAVPFMNLLIALKFYRFALVVLLLEFLTCAEDAHHEPFLFLLFIRL